ncbi:MAG: 2-dehydropantoate 2-reductase [Rubrivivax sp.]|nr:MAG: 2-dehydropantoate 2-reductase [Rubrivivax sp.]
MASVAVVGAGAVGCTVLGWLAQDPYHRLTVLSRSKSPAIELRTPDQVLHAEPQVAYEASELVGCDWVLVTTKAYDSQVIAASLSGLAGSGARLAIMQNGVEHLEPFKAHFPIAQLLPVMVDIPSTRTGPGRVTQHRRGRMCVPRGALGSGFAALFRTTAIDVNESDDFKTEIWKKLCLNAAGAFSAVLLRPAVIARHVGVSRLMEQLIAEASAVAQAEGADLPEELAATIVEGYRRSPAGVNSLHADRLEGRPMEIDARNGVVVRLGRKHGIPTPVNEMVVSLLEASQLQVD